MRLNLVETACVNPYDNLALERYLLESVQDDQVILYLWQNSNTVVIGRNQSALAECRIQDLIADGGLLARRLSGGGAVYHDLGNLNFTFLAPTDLFDEEKQTEVVLRAVQMLGIPAKRTGRNDLVAEGGKFSGHAYYHRRGRSYHHGTLLISADAGKMAAYLNPSPLKLAAKGVKSVKSRVCNLADLKPGLSVGKASRAMADAFAEVYEGEVSTLNIPASAQAIIDDYRAEFASKRWILKDERPCENSREARFDWGCVRVDWDARGGAIARAALYTDGLDADFLDAAPAALAGCPAQEDAIAAALSALAEDTPDSTKQRKEACARDISKLIMQGRQS